MSDGAPPRDPRTPQVTRLPIRLEPDDRRVISRLFVPGDDARTRRIVERILAVPEPEVEQVVERLRQTFASRHRDIGAIVGEHYDAVREYVAGDRGLSRARRQLIGFFFTSEYAIEAAALFNPSMIPAVDQGGIPPGAVRFLMSLRATGEGHVSSIVFRQGTIGADGAIEIEPASPYSRPLATIDCADHDKESFRRKLAEMGALGEDAEAVLRRIDGRVDLSALRIAADEEREAREDPETIAEAVETMLWLARSNYTMWIPRDMDPSEFVIFPHSESESHGIEDARFVRFTDDDGSMLLYAVYTAYSGYQVIPQILEIRPEESLIRVHSTSGRGARNKDMALFPRRLDGQYAMIGRLDNENLYLLRSDAIDEWDGAEIIQEPAFLWQTMQLGNCGSPLETEAGWLMLTHGVGPMRQYAIGATLLDRDDPTRLIGQTREPLLAPTDADWPGYVPNVVYSCGGMIHNDLLVIPYAMSDKHCSFATVPLGDLLGSLTA